MSAAGGAAPGARDRAWSRFEPSISRRRVAASGSRSGCGIDAIVRVSRAPGYDRPMGLLLLVDLDGVVYRGTTPSRVSPRSLPIARHVATTSCT